MLYQKNPQMEFIENDDSMVVFDPDSGDTCILDEIGDAIIRALGTSGNAETVTQVLAPQYQAPTSEIQRDVEEFLKQLLEQRMIIPCE